MAACSATWAALVLGLLLGVAVATPLNYIHPRSLLATVTGGPAPSWRLTFKAIVDESVEFELTARVKAQATDALEAAAKQAGIKAAISPTFTVPQDVGKQQVDVQVQVPAADEGGLRALADALTDPEPPKGLMGQYSNTTTYSDAQVTWVCPEGSTLCAGECVDGGDLTVTVRARQTRFLSVNWNASDTAVGTWTEDNRSGRQRWRLTPAGLGPDTFEVVVAGGRQGQATALGATGDSSLGLLASNTRGAGAGCRRWRFRAVNATARTFTISCTSGLGNPAKNVLTVDRRGRASLWFPLASAEQRAAQQVFEVAAVTPAQPVAVTKRVTVSQAKAKATAAQAKARAQAVTNAPVFVGGAWEKSMADLAQKPGAWATTAAGAGYWLHPMGLTALKQKGLLRTLMTRFGRKSFVYEMDLFASTDPSTAANVKNALVSAPVWADQARAASGFSCAFYAPWVAGDRLATQLEDVTRRYKQLANRMRAAGYGSGYFFYAPPAPETLAHADTLLNRRVGGLSHVEHVVKAAGLRGIVLDFPAHLVLSPTLPARYGAGAGNKARALAKQAHDIAQRLNIKFCWVFNGADVGVQAAMDYIQELGMSVDCWAVDNFAAQFRAGTPESDPSSVSGQALNVIKWLRVGGAPASKPEEPETVTTRCVPYDAFD